jgi:putative YphP/YqiW family bacilliredoxin
MRDEYIDEMVTTPFRSVLKKIYTPEEVDATFHGQKGTMLVFIDSNCGCAGRIARPALELAVGHYHKPDEFVTTFASIDRDATARARSYFTDQPPSSPSFALLRDGEFVGMIHRADIERSSPGEVARLLTDLFDKFCIPRSAK